MNRILATLIIAAGITSTARADLVTVTATGTVVFNGINTGPLGGVNGGESVTLSFEVDSNIFMDGVPGDTRGYVIDQSSFSLAFDSATLGLESPFPAGQTPYFTLVDGFPVSDGFFVSTSPFSPGGVPLEQDPFECNLSLGYDGGTLTSLDILDALGTYDFTGLTSFGFNLWSVFPDNVAMGIDFEMMTIAGDSTSIGTIYCDPAVPNSTGLSGKIEATGSVFIVDNDVTLTASCLPPNVFGYCIAGPSNGPFAPANSNGIFCLKGGDPGLVGRFDGDVFNSGAAGTGSLMIDLTAIPIAGQGGAPPFTIALMPGDTWNFQCWYRDGSRNNFTSAVSITFQ